MTAVGAAAAVPSRSPVITTSPLAQDALIDPKTGLLPGMQPVRLPATVMSPQTPTQPTPPPAHGDSRSTVMTPPGPRAGIPQPTVLPPRHDQQVRPAPRLP